MNVKGTDIAYWDEGNRKMFPWYKKGFWKKHFRKKFYRKLWKNWK